MERHPFADPEPGRPFAQLGLAVAATVQVETDVEVGAVGRQSADGVERDLELVGRGQRAGVDDPQRAVGSECPARMRAGVEQLEVRRVRHDRQLGRIDPEPEQAVGHRAR